MAQVFKSPAAYVQGQGVADEIGSHAASLGEKALLLADNTVLEIVEDRVRASLAEAGLDATATEFEGEASESETERLTRIARNHDIDVVIGAGGGKALDTAKAVREDLDGSAMVSMPTVASTDAPTSALSVIYTDHGEFEEYWFYDAHPDLVLVDTQIIAQAPVRFFRSGIADGLATWFEADAAYQSEGETIVGGTSTRAGHQLARLCYETLRDHGLSAVDAVERGAVTEAVEAVTEANTLLSGLGFESGGLAAAHSIHNGLTQLDATHDATHGEKVNIGIITQLILEGRKDSFIGDYITFSRQLGLPVTLADIGIEDPTGPSLDTVAEAACDDAETIHNQPFGVTVPMVRDALKTVDGVADRVR